MKRLAALALFTLTLTLATTLPSPIQAAPIPATGTVEVFFSPQGGTEQAIVKELSQAKREILIQAYSFTNRAIAKAIIEAKKRGVKVEAVLDRSNRTGKYSAATFLLHAGVPVWIDSQHPIAHNNIIIIDRATLITGSFNFSKAAEEKNAENLLVLKGNQALVDRYVENFGLHKRHSEAFKD